MATVKMQKGNLYADIFDSPETIATATAQGYVLVKDAVKTVKAEPKEVYTADAEKEKTAGGRKSSK